MRKDRDSDRDKRRDRDGDRERRDRSHRDKEGRHHPYSRERGEDHRGHRKDVSRSSDKERSREEPKPQSPSDVKVIDPVVDEEEMRKLMGFTSFDSTKVSILKLFIQLTNCSMVAG